MQVIIENLTGNCDEGAKKFFAYIAREYSLKNISVVRTDIDSALNKLYFGKNSKILKKLSKQKVALYFPHSSATLASIFRSRRISKILKCPVSIASLQHKPLNALEKLLVGLIKPAHVFYQEKQAKDFFTSLGIRTDFLPSGVDIEKFKPTDFNNKAVLREKYGFNNKDLIALHVGHLNEGRGIEVMAELPKEITPVLVASTSTMQDKRLADQLIRKGVKVITEYLPKIEEIYQLSDIFVFPTQKSGSAIGCPLSVLEAMACNLKVISTRFQGLPKMFDDGKGLFFYERQDELRKKFKSASSLNEVFTREKALNYSWGKIADYMIDKLDTRKVS